MSIFPLPMQHLLEMNGWQVWISSKVSLAYSVQNGQTIIPVDVHGEIRYGVVYVHPGLIIKYFAKYKKEILCRYSKSEVEYFFDRDIAMPDYGQMLYALINTETKILGNPLDWCLLSEKDAKDLVVRLEVVNGYDGCTRMGNGIRIIASRINVDV